MDSLQVPHSAPTAAPTILLTGATGTVGQALAQTLADRGIPFRALVRQPGAPAAQWLASLPSAEVVLGDFDDPASLQQALVGIERAFLLTNSTEQAEAQQLRFVKLARQAGVLHVVKLSQWAADAASPVRFLCYHAVVEQAIRAAGLTYTFLRPNLFMQGLLAFKDSIKAQGQFFAPIGDACISVIDVRDIAAVAAAALTEPGHENQTYNLTGPAALTHAEMAASLAEALGHPVTFIDVPPAALRGYLAQAGFPEWQTEGLLEDYAHYQRGEAAVVTYDVQKVTGQLPRNFAAFARAYAPAFR